MRLIAAAIVATIVLTACSDTGLRNLRNPSDGPDEFSIVPAKPLETPESFTALPEPTPGGFNRTDQRPLEDGVAAFGGQRTSSNAPVPGVDAALVNYTNRFGSSANIRSQLATEDAAFRQRQGRFTNIRIFREDVYAQAYRRQALDPGPVADAYRRAGVPTPSAPPTGGR